MNAYIVYGALGFLAGFLIGVSITVIRHSVAISNLEARVQRLEDLLVL